MGLDGPAYQRDADAVDFTTLVPGVTVPTVATHSGSPLVSGDMWEEPQWVKPDPSEGGRTGAVGVLGYSTGFNGHNTRVSRFTGRTLAPPQIRANPAFGPVGKDSRADRLALGVAQQQTDFLPSVLDIAKSFTTGRGSANLRASFGAQGAGGDDR